MRLQVWPNFLTLQVAYQNIQVARSHQMDTTKWEQPQPLGMGQGGGGRHHGPCATPSICLGTGAAQKSAISSYFSVLQTGQMWDAHTLPTQPVHRQK